MESTGKTEGKKLPNLSRKKIAQASLSIKVKSIILASMLSNGRLNKNEITGKTYFIFQCSLENKRYFYWKVEMLREISLDDNFAKKVERSNGKESSLIFRSKESSELTEIQSVVYKNGFFLLRRRGLNHLTALSLAVGWYEKGNIVLDCGGGFLYASKFSKKSVDIIIRYLKVRGGLKAHRQESKNVYHIGFDTEELKKLFFIILPFVSTLELLKKVLLIHRDKEIQERGISEIKNLIPHYSLYIDSELDIMNQKMI